jgi:hypothetical protein
MMVRLFKKNNGFNYVIVCNPTSLNKLNCYELFASI